MVWNIYTKTKLSIEKFAQSILSFFKFNQKLFSNNTIIHIFRNILVFPEEKKAKLLYGLFNYKSEYIAPEIDSIEKFDFSSDIWYWFYLRHMRTKKNRVWVKTH